MTPIRLIARFAAMVCALAATACANGPMSAPFGLGDEAFGPATPSENAAALHAAGEHAAAAQAFEQVLENDPDNAAARLGLGEALAAEGDVAGAMSAYGALVADDVYGSRAQQGIGLVYLSSGQAGLAEPALLAAVEADPSLWRAWTGLARIHDLRSDGPAADAAYERALTASPRPAVVFNNHGFSLLSRGDYDRALSAFSLAIDHEPDLEIAQVNRAIALAMVNDYAQLATERTGDQAARDYNNAGYIAMLRGDYDAAETLFAQALRASPVFFGPAFENLQALERLRTDAGA